MNKTLVRIGGNTFPVKDKLKALGARFNPPGYNDRAWFIAPSLVIQAQAIVAGPATQSAAPVAKALVLDYSDEQKAIFGWFATGVGNLIVQARAGTGKTTTIKHAFSYLQGKLRVLYAVFGKKNQVEAQAKISDPRVEVRTLHSLGKMFINQVWRDAAPDDEGCIEFDRIRSVIGSALSMDNDLVSTIERLVGFCKNLVVGVPDLNTVIQIADDRDIFIGGELAAQFPASRLAQIAIDVLKASMVRDSRGRISFNDMVWLPVAMGWVKPTYDFIAVDETQDMNLSQLAMVEQALKPEGRACLVGDNRQAIYTFRGAASDGMHLMKVKLNATEMGLTTTYRCPKLVVAEARQFVPDYNAAPSAPEGEVLEMSIDAAMQRLVVGDAVVSRLNAPLMGICLNLLRNNIPARIEGRDVGKQLVKLVRKFKANSVPDFLAKVGAWKKKQVARILASGGNNAQKKSEQILDEALTLETVAQDMPSVAAIEQKILGLFEDSDKARKPAVVCSSVHKAKGLEWNTVCILTETFRHKSTEGEEANIYYVAITRTKRTLIKAC